MFALIVWACLTGSPHAQSVTTRPEQLAGPWEMATPARVDGIFLMIYRSNAQPESIQVRVYLPGCSPVSRESCCSSSCARPIAQ